MAIVLAQAGSGSANTGGSVVLTFGGNTTAGNLLVAGVVAYSNPTAYTPPAGWTQIGSTTGSGPYLTVFYQENCGVSNNYDFTNTIPVVFDPTAVVGAEYSGVAASGSLDPDSDYGTGSSAAPASKVLTTATADEILVAFLCQRHATTMPAFSTPANSFADELEASATGNFSTARIKIALLDRLVAATGAYDTALTSDQNTAWAAWIGGFAAAAAFAGQPPRPRFFFRPVHPAEIFE